MSSAIAKVPHQEVCSNDLGLWLGLETGLALGLRDIIMVRDSVRFRVRGSLCIRVGRFCDSTLMYGHTWNIVPGPEKATVLVANIKHWSYSDRLQRLNMYTLDKRRV